ncbi:unnamed protein product [Absidia cylindrospora]
MTDGDRDVIVYELNKIPSMNLKTPFGSKVQITFGHYATGILLVKPENFQLLGGQVPELYGDTMENELLRRYRRQLQLQSNTEPDGTTTRIAPRQVTTSTPISAHQNTRRPTNSTASVATISTAVTNYNNRRPTVQTTLNAFPQQPNPPTGATNSNDFDEFDEFDDWPADDFSDLAELEQQATTALIRASSTTPSNSINTSRNLHSPRPIHGSSSSFAMDDEFSQRRGLSMDRSSTSTPTSTVSAPKQHSTVSLSTKSKLSVNRKAATSRPTYIELDDTPSPPLRPQTNPDLQKATISEFDDMGLDSSFWIDDLSQEVNNGNITDQSEAPGLLSVSELRTLLRSVDDNSFTGSFDKVSVQVKGCQLRKMKPIANEGLYLTVELLENYSHEKRITVTFKYFGINSSFEGYTLEEIQQIAKKYGEDTVKEKVFMPLKSRFKKIQAVLEIDLMLTEMDKSNTVVRKGINFTPVASS